MYLSKFLFAFVLVSTLASNSFAQDEPKVSAEGWLTLSGGAKNQIKKILFTPDSRTLIVAKGLEVELWSSESGALQTALDVKDIVRDIALSADGKTLAIVASSTGYSEPKVVFWDMQRPPVEFALSEPANAIAFSPDSRMLIVGTMRGNIQLLDMSGNVRQTIEAHATEITTLAFSADGSLLASAAERKKDQDLTLKLWNTSNFSEQKLWGNMPYGGTVKISNDAKYLANSDGSLTLRLTKSGHQLRTFAERVTGFDFSPDGTLIAAGESLSSQTTKVVSIYHVASGKLLRRMPINTFLIKSIVFSPDGKLLAAGSETTVQLWKLSGVAGRVPLLLVPKMPPKLAASVELQEPSGNRILDEGEEGAIVVTVKNIGQGEAEGVHARATLISDNAMLFFRVSNVVERLSPGASEKIVIPLLTSSVKAKVQAKVKIELKERSGFDLESPVLLAFECAPAPKPVIALVEVRLNDASGNGRIEPRESVEITVRLQNQGGEVKLPIAEILLGEGVFLTPDSKQEIKLNSFKTGETKDVVFSVFTSADVKSALPISISIKDASRSLSTIVPLGLTLNKTYAKSISSVAIAGSAKDTDTRSDVDIDIPKSKQNNPDAIAIILGIESYRSIAGVPFARRDAEIFKAYAVQVLGVPDDKNHLYLATDAAVTLGELKKLFGEEGWLAKRVRANSDVYVFYAGHGAPELKEKSPFLIPYDGDANYAAQTGFSLNQLYERLGALNARAVTVFLDACFSGVTRDNQPMLEGSRPVSLKINNPILKSEKLLVFAASSDEQISSGYPEKQHGLFTYFLLKGLRGEADANQDKRLTAEELESYLKREVSRAAANLDREQTPEATGREKLRTLITY